MANIQNLKPIRSKSEAREKGRIGGINSGKNRRKRKAMKEQLEKILSLPFNLQDEFGNQLIEKYKFIGIKENDLDNQMIMCIELFLTAISNSNQKIQAIKTIREIIQDDKSPDTDTRVIIIDDILE